MRLKNCSTWQMPFFVIPLLRFRDLLRMAAHPEEMNGQGMKYNDDAMRNNPTSQPSQTGNIFAHLGWLIAIFVLYAVFFFIPLPPQFKRQGIFLADELILLILLGLVFLTFRYTSIGAKYLRLGLILIAFTLPLLRLWETAESTWNIVLGLLPWADATEYYFDASRLMQGGLFSAFSGRRPLFTSLLTILLELSRQNLQITLIIFTILNGLVVFFFVEEIHTEFGTVSAVVALYLSQFFYRPFVGTTLTEQLGVPIGILALIVLIRAVRSSRVWLFSVGLLLLTYALLIRAGAFFVLPFLVVYAVIHFAKGRQDYIRILLMVILAVIIPVLSNGWLGGTAASSNAVTFGNFADTLYGQAKGGVRWTQAAIDHPEVAALAEPERSQQLYRLAFEEIKINPLGLVRGSIKAWTDFIRPGGFSAFGFVTLGNKNIDRLLQIFKVLLFLFGVWLLWKRRENQVSRLIMVCWAGIFLSIHFLPPIDAGIRPYAATIGLLFLPVCFVFSLTIDKLLQNINLKDQGIPVGISYSLAFLLIFISLIGAPLLRSVIKPVQAQPVTCESGLIPISFKLQPGSYIQLSQAESGQGTKVPVVRISDVQRSFDEFAYGEFAALMRKLKQPSLIAVTTDVSTGQGFWVVAPAELESHPDQVISACAETVFATYPVMLIKTVATP